MCEEVVERDLPSRAIAVLDVTLASGTRKIVEDANKANEVVRLKTACHFPGRELRDQTKCGRCSFFSRCCPGP